MLHEGVLLAGSWHSFSALWAHTSHLVLNLLCLETVVDVVDAVTLDELVGSVVHHVGSIIVRLLSHAFSSRLQVLVLKVQLLVRVLLLHLIGYELVVLGLGLVILHVDDLIATVFLILFILVLRHHILEVRVLITVHVYSLFLCTVVRAKLSFSMGTVKDEIKVNDRPHKCISIAESTTAHGNFASLQ